MIKYSEQIILKFLGLIKLFFPFLKNKKKLLQLGSPLLYVRVKENKTTMGCITKASY